MRDKASASESTPLMEIEPENGHHGSFESEEALKVVGGRVLSKTPVINHISESELTNLVETFAAEDKDEDKTWGRRLVEKYLEKRRWYFPGGTVKDGPSLSSAWAFFGEKIAMQACDTLWPLLFYLR